MEALGAAPLQGRAWQNKCVESGLQLRAHIDFCILPPPSRLTEFDASSIASAEGSSL